MLNDNKCNPKVMIMKIQGQEGALEDDRILLYWRYFEDRDLERTH